MKRILCLILSVMMIVTGPAMTVFARPDWPADTGIQSEAGIVMDIDSETVLFGQNIHEKKAPASITKLLTALVVVENSANLDDMVTFSGDAFVVEDGSGNKLSLAEGDALSVRDCLYVMLLQSSNQAANALAEHVAGSRSAFVDMMNKKVQELGCENSQFANPSGLNDESQRTTAYDMALIARAAYENPALLEIGSVKSHKIGATKNNPNGVTFAMEHKLIVTTDPNSETYYPDAVAGKTGYTSIAGQTLVTYAKRDGRRLIAVTLGSRERTHYQDTIALLDFGFNEFENVKITEGEAANAPEGPIAIGGQDYDKSDLSVGENDVITIPKEAAFADAERKLETVLPSAHPEGAVAMLSYEYNERKIGSTYIISAKALAGNAASVSGEEESGGDIPASGSASDSDNESKNHRKWKLPKLSLPKLPQNSGALAAAAVVLGAAAGVGVFFVQRKKAIERRELEARRERRRQRLREIGCPEEEFERLLEERKNMERRRR